MLTTEKLITKWVESDVKTVLKEEHTQWRQASIRRNQIKSNVHLTTSEKRAAYNLYCDKLQETLDLMSNGVRIGKVPRFDD